MSGHSIPPTYIKSTSPYSLTFLPTPSNANAPLPSSTHLLIKLSGLLNNYPPSHPAIIKLIEQCRLASSSSTSIPSSIPSSTSDSKKLRTMSLLDKVISGPPPSDEQHEQHSLEAKPTASLDIREDVSLHDLSSLLLTGEMRHTTQALLYYFLLTLHCTHSSPNL